MKTLCEATLIFPYLLPDGRVLPCIAMSGSEMEDIAPNIFDEGQSLEKALSASPIDTYTHYTYKELFEKNSECAVCEHRYQCSGCRANALANGGFFEKDPFACCFVKGGYADKVQNKSSILLCTFFLLCGIILSLQQWRNNYGSF